MSIVKYILSEELQRLQQLAQYYDDQLKQLPKGSLSIKVYHGNKYVYLAHREGSKIIFKYLGKESSRAVKMIAAERQKRLAYIMKQRAVKKDIDEIRRALNAVGR